MPGADGQPTPEELIRQKLAQMLAQGKTPAPGQAANGGTVPPASNPQNPQDATPQTGTPAPTLTPVTPQGQPSGAAAGTPTQKPPYMSDEEWAKQNPGTVPAPPSFKEPSWKSNLAHALAYGAMEFGRPGTGARAADQYVTNYEQQKNAADTATRNMPTTIHTARQAEETEAERRAQSGATIEGTNLENDLRRKELNTPAQGSKQTVDEQLSEAIRKNDSATVDRILDIQKRQAAAKNDPAALQLEEWKLALYKSNPKAFNAMYGESGSRPQTAGEFQYELYKKDRPAFDAIFGGKDRTTSANQLKFLQAERDKVSQTYDKQINDILTTPQEKATLEAEKTSRLANYEQQIALLQAGGGAQPAAAGGAPPAQPKTANDPFGIR